VRAVGNFLRGCSQGTAAPLKDPVVIRFGLWEGFRLGAELGIPMQVHAGFGDPDLTLHLADPSRFTPFVKAIGPLGVTTVFLHCYPYHRQAGYLSAVFPCVYFDVGGALNHLGPGGQRVVAEALEVAPFTKQLYSSDAFGLAELYPLGSVAFRTSLRTVLDGWVADENLTAGDAHGIETQICRENARRIYPALATPAR
jgi:predicted TIM-barrel fold metal-dependent hydrolase